MRDKVRQNKKSKLEKRETLKIGYASESVQEGNIKTYKSPIQH